MFTIKDILRIEVAPALGCTEPAAVALCTAAAGTLLDNKDLQSIEVWLSPSIYKNAFAVAIPGTGGQVGIDLAAALGFYGGDPNSKLQVLEPVTDEHIDAAHRLIQNKSVHVHLLEDKSGIFVRTILATAQETAEAVIEKTHDNLVSLKYNDNDVSDSPLLSNLAETRNDIDDLENFLRDRSLAELLVLVEKMDEEDYAFIQEGIQSNLKLAQHGIDVKETDGIIARTPEQTMKNMGQISAEGMIDTDQTILRIMIEKKLTDKCLQCPKGL